MKWLHSHTALTGTVSEVEIAARNGNLEMLQWLHETCQARTSTALEAAASTGHIKIVEWLLDQDLAPHDQVLWALNVTARGGHLTVIQLLSRRFTGSCLIHAMNYAATGSHLDIVRWFHENRSEGCTKHAMNAAASEGHLAVVQWFHENRTEGCDGSAMGDAAAKATSWSCNGCMRIDQGPSQGGNDTTQQSTATGTLLSGCTRITKKGARQQ